MVFRRSRKKEIIGSSINVDKEKPERISNKLEHVVVTEDPYSSRSFKQRLKQTALKAYRHKRFKPAAIALAVVILLGIIGIVFFWPDPAPQPEPTVITSEGVVLKKLSEEDLAKEIDILVLQKKFKSAEDLINFQDNTNSKNIKMTLASVYINNQKTEDAIRILKEIEMSFGEDWQVAKLVGEQYLQAGDKQNAIVYFEKALSLLEKAGDIPLKQDEIAFIKSFIKIAEGKNSTEGIEQ